MCESCNGYDVMTVCCVALTTRQGWPTHGGAYGVWCMVPYSITDGWT